MPVRPVHKSFMKQKLTSVFALALACFCLSACQSDEPAGGALTATVDSRSAVSALQRINAQALTCWIKSGDKDFKPYALVPELDTTAGTPRILVVERGKAQGLPKLVITASGSPARLSTFGPLTGDVLAGRINSDILAWSAGRKGCA